ncbi:MAG: hypothetical protein KKD63_15620 [Proteobacteria bacterium]|nr:hypothetical protein [Desulfobulbaceae bacterium]MBU4154298.1 hypothetical protein [Pseudomonadota bacterium]MDP2106442.1 hypothetical protein [Desulfobulbaceae bacterium]
MDEYLEKLLNKIKELEQELRQELLRKQEEFYYRIDQGKVRFEHKVRLRHQKLSKKIHHYFIDASILNIMTIPLIWGCLPPTLLLDMVATLYQHICFPVYGIPKVKRSQHVIFDHHSLAYLNLIEKINCAYCSYFNGLLSYLREIGARTEQYWCPIKHAKRGGHPHSRYHYFFDFGDGEGYQQKLEEVRRAFNDIDDKKQES